MMAEIIGEDEEYIESLEKTGWTKKRNIQGSKGFSVPQKKMSDVKLEEYKSSVHSPSLFEIPKGSEKRKNIDEFSDKEIKEFMENTSPDQFDEEMAAAIYSRYTNIKRKEQYKKSGFSPSREHSDDETDVDVRLTKSQKKLEKALKMQQNIIDMEITKQQDKDYKALIEKENTLEINHPG
jgi:hypothetical protein